MSTRVWVEPDGSVKITTFVVEDLKDRDCATLIRDGAVHPDSTFVDYPEKAPVPTSRRFRNCWTHDGKEIVVHPDRARNQLMAEVRIKRNAELVASDGEMLRAQEQGLDTTALAQKRQALRDKPYAVEQELAKLSVAELEQYIV